jgi:shikimate kinase
MKGSVRERHSFSRVLLTGFMGAGKSTVGRLLAPRMNWGFLDLDEHIEATAGATAQSLFATLGEAAFRQLESDTLASSLDRSETIIAVGGAAIDMERNQLLLRNCHDGLVVFLDAPFETLIERCLLQERSGDATYRPLLHRTDVARARYAARRSLYSAHAHLTIDVAEQAPDYVARRICDEMVVPKERGRHSPV